jgi:hypothetical protein
MSQVLLMVLATDGGQHGPSMWVAARLNGERVLSPEQAEWLAANYQHAARFLMPYTAQTADFASGVTLATMPGESIWNYGLPTWTDSLKVLHEVAAEGVQSPEPFIVLLPVASVTRGARQRFGNTEKHDLEAHFDRLVADLEGRREGDPAAYRVHHQFLYATGVAA